MSEEIEVDKNIKTDDLMSIHLVGYEVLEKSVKTSGNSGRVYLPASWIGKRVKIIRIEPIEDSED